MKDLLKADPILAGEIEVKVREAMKASVAPPFQRAEFDIMLGEGISKIGEIIDLGVVFGVIKRPDNDCL